MIRARGELTFLSLSRKTFNRLVKKTKPTRLVFRSLREWNTSIAIFSAPEQSDGSNLFSRENGLDSVKEKLQINDVETVFEEWALSLKYFDERVVKTLDGTMIAAAINARQHSL